MVTKRTYQKDRIGTMSRKVSIYTPTYQRNVLGGEKPQWVLWVTVFMEAMRGGGGEKIIADKVTALNEKHFRCRTLSANGLNETMILRYGNEDHDITHIGEDYSDKRGHFTIITAERRKENITPIVFLAGNIAMDYSQTFANQTATTLTVTAGTLPDPGTKNADYFHQMVFVFRSGVRMIYGNTGPDGYSVSGNDLVFVQKLRGENVLMHQYTTA